MDLKKIQEILNIDMDDKFKELQILRHLSTDKNVLPHMLEIINAERETKQNLISEMNMELSRADCHIEKSGGEAEMVFIRNSIHTFYKKNQAAAPHCFRDKDWYDKPLIPVKVKK